MFERTEVGECRIGRAVWLNQHQRFNVIWIVQGGLKAEGTALTVHHDHARPHLFHIGIVGCLRDGIVREPTRYRLFGELVKGLSRKFSLRIGEALSRVRVISGANAKKLPSF